MAETSVEASAHATGDRLPLGSVPLLVYAHGTYPNVRQTIFSVADRSLRTHVVPELTENTCHVTSHGWVFLQDPGSLHARLWNPRSGEVVGLPATEHELPEAWRCYLSDAPTASSCVVLLLYLAEPRFLYCRVGDARWIAHEYDIGDVDLPPEYAPPRRRVIRQTAVVDGRFYILEMGKLGAIDFSPEPAFTYLDYPRLEFPDGYDCADSYLVASRGELFRVNVYFTCLNPEIVTMRVYKFNDLSGPGPATLSVMDSLGDSVFFLSYINEQLLCSASKYGLKGSRIYMMHNVMDKLDGGSLCIYDMDDQSLETLQPCQDMQEPMCCPFWMLPTDSD